jgi:deoxyhypusine synthase
MPLDDAIAAARKVAETEGIREVFVLDRTAGKLEHDVIEHAGDHSFAGKKLDDNDLEENEKGADMRDRRP